MMDWANLWSPAVILGGTGTLGLFVSSRPHARRWIAPGCLLSLVLVALSWSDAAGDDLARATCTVSLIWGTLLSVLHWSDKRCFALPLQWVLLAGLCLMSQAGDVVTLFLGLQIASLGANVLSSRRGRLPSVHQFPLSWLLLLGCLFLVTVTGSTRLETIHEALQTSYVNRESARFAIAGGGSRLLMLSAIFIGTALAGYTVCTPFHFSLAGDSLNLHAEACAVPSTEDGANDAAARVSELRFNELLWQRAAALLAWIKLWPVAITASEPTAHVLIGVLAAITAVVPMLQARVERHLVRQWWLLAVAQGSWLLLAIAAWSFVKKSAPLNPAWPVVEWNLPTAAQGAWLLLLLDGVSLIGFCGVLTFLRRRDRPVEFVDDLRGLFHFEPIAAVCASICLLSLSGVPLLAGFWSRQFLVLVAMNVRGDWGAPSLLVPHSGLLLLTALLALSAIWTTSIAMRSVWTMLFGLPSGQPRPVGTVSSLFSAVLASLLLIGCGVLPGPLLSWLCAPRVKQQVPLEPQKAPAFADRGGSQ